MNARILLAVASIGLVSIVACDADGDGRTAVGDSDSTAIDRIAGDKDDVAMVMRRAHDRGTLDDAMEIALADSALASALSEILRGDSRFSSATSDRPVEALTTTPAAQRQSTKSGSGSSAKSTSTTTPSKTEPRGDVLDQTERTAQKVNERLEQAERVKREAAEAKRRLEDIIGKKP